GPSWMRGRRLGRARPGEFHPGSVSRESPSSRDGARCWQSGVGFEGRRIFTLAQSGRDLVPDLAEGGVDVVGVDGQGVGRSIPPEDVNRAGQQPEHAPGPLERAQGRELLSQNRESLWVERIAPAKQVSDLGSKYRCRQVD